MVRLDGREIGSIGLGTAQFAFKPESDVASAVQVIHAAVEHGVKFIDTARAYIRHGLEAYAEHIVRRALSSGVSRNDVVVATKGGHWRDGDMFFVDGSPLALRQHCEASLRALGTDRIDLYQLQWVDDQVPTTESVGALRDLQMEGKICQIGLSNVSIPQLELSRRVAPIASVQNRFSFDHREDLPMAQYCAENGIAHLAYMPLGGPGSIPPSDGDCRHAVAANHGASVQQVALTWILRQAESILPIVGSSRVSTIVASASASSIGLSDVEMDVLNQWEERRPQR